MAKKTIIEEYPVDLEQEEEDVLSRDDSAEQPPTDIVAFNELRSCADLVRMHRTKQLDIKPDFQRDIVWANAQQTRFIDSLTKQLPIPSMCIGLDLKTNKRIVIDGLQRMWSTIRFLTEDNWKLSNLTDIDPRISGCRVSYIKEKHPSIFGKVENLTIPVTVLRCDSTKSNHMEYLFTIFHRLNTGGNKLTNQEIRNCIYTGSLNDLLRNLVKYNEFRDIFGLKDEKGYRFAYEEFVLRFLAFTEKYSFYDGKLSQFLNTYMEERRNLDSSDLGNMESLFERTTKIIFEKIAGGKALPKLSKATYEALFVGVAKNIDALEQATKTQLAGMFKKMRGETEFDPENLKNAITTKDKLIARMNKAIEVFS